MPSQSPASAAIPRLVRPPQVPSFTPGRPGAVPQPQLQQQAPQLSQQQLQQWYAQQLKAQQQRQLEQQIYMQQQNYTSQQPALSGASQHECEEVPSLSSTALPFSGTASDAHQLPYAQEMLMQQLLQQQLYEAAVIQQQQQQMKATVSAGAINLIQNQASDGIIPPASTGSAQFVAPEADQLSSLRRASEGQVCTTSTSASVASSVQTADCASRTATSTESQSTDIIPPVAVTSTVDISSSQCRDETFKVPFLSDHVRYYIFEYFTLFVTLENKHLTLLIYKAYSLWYPLIIFQRHLQMTKAFIRH